MKSWLKQVYYALLWRRKGVYLVSRNNEHFIASEGNKQQVSKSAKWIYYCEAQANRTELRAGKILGLKSV